MTSVAGSSNGPPPGGDILAEERSRRQRSKFRFLRLLSPWGRRAEPMPAGMRFMVILLTVGLLVLGAWTSRDYFIDRALGAAQRIPFVPAPGLALDPEAGRALRGDEYAVAVNFGEPLTLGESGRPLVRFADGTVRELTLVEVLWDSSVTHLPIGEDQLNFGPGPRGWGMLFDAGQPDGRPDYLYTRQGWAERQHFELRRAAALVSQGMQHYVAVDEVNFQPEPGRALAELARELGRTNEHTLRGDWGLAPAYWGCDEGLERDLSRGVTPGCPGGVFKSDLASAWRLIGVLSRQFDRMAETSLFMERATRADWGYGGVHDSLLQQREEFRRNVASLETVLDRLRARGSALKLPMEVRLLE